jgi:hypothetical protein
LSDLTPEPVDWLWPGVLATGKLTLIDGDPNQGKSLFALDLAARLTTGRALADGHVPPGPQSVVLLGGEDGIRDTVIPRLIAAGADRSRIHVIGAPPVDGGPGRPPSLPEDCDLIAETMRRTASRLLIADPLFAYLSRSLCALNDSAIRQALAPLARLAEGTRSAVLMSRHLTKGTGKQAIYRGSGSIALIGLARAAFLVARAPNDPDLHVLACTKNNLGPLPPSLGYRIRRVDDDQAVLDWTGPVAMTADELVLGSLRAWGGALPEAIAFLEQLLQAGPVAAAEVYAKARTAGIADRTLNRAKIELSIQSEQQWCDGRKSWHWKLPAAASLLPPEEAHQRFLEHFWNVTEGMNHRDTETQRNLPTGEQTQ